MRYGSTTGHYLTVFQVEDALDTFTNDSVATGSMYTKLNQHELSIPYVDPVATAPGSVFVVPWFG